MASLPHSPERWRIPKRFEVQRIIGSGAFGTVCEAYDHDSTRLVAIKQVRGLFDSKEVAKKTLRELKILTACDHDGVVRLYDAFIPKRSSCFSELYMIMEIGDTDMRKLIQLDCTLQQPHNQLMLYNLLLGLKYLHSAGIYHRDLKPENILVNQDCSVKICDFNLACTAPETELLALNVADTGGPEPPNQPIVPSTIRAQRQLTQLVTSRWYRAPEVILLQPQYTEAIDVWSVGCIFAELLEMLDGGRSCDDRCALFPGVTAYPADTRSRRRGHDQLHLIIDMLGTPTQDEVENLAVEAVRQYVRSLPFREGRELSSRYPWAQSEELDLLSMMVRFDPNKRVTVNHALEHNFFRTFRSPNGEVAAPTRIRLDFEDSGEDLDEARLRQHFYEHLRKMRDTAHVAVHEASAAGA